LGRPAARLIAAVFAAGLALGAAAGERSHAPKEPRPAPPPRAQTPWTALAPDERRVLGPIADHWDRMPGEQQQRFITSARRYPSLQPIQKERFDSRLRTWAEMTPEQRRAARETYQGLRRLPPAQQHELRERWLQRHHPGEESSEPSFAAPPGNGPQRGPGPVAPDYTRKR
jgi:hypothetical protein